MPALTLKNPPSLLLACAAVCMFSQTALPGQETPDKHQNSLGQDFLPVPGATVLFATTEVRMSDFQAFVQAANYAWSFTPHFKQEADHPAIGVSLVDARAFCTWLTDKERSSGALKDDQQYRLPDDAEWSAAAGLVRFRKSGTVLTAEETLGDQKRFPWGLDWPPTAGAGNLAEDEIPGFTDAHIFTAPVGTSTASRDGLFDLAGNVWEWTLESGANSSGHLRGGSWAYFNQETLRSNYIYEVSPDLRAATVGFRVVLEDRKRAARLLAENQTRQATQIQERQTQMQADATTSASAEEIAAMRLRLAGKEAPAAAGALPDPASLSPAKPGAAHTNSIGMTLKPLPGGATLLATTEVTARQYELYLEAGGQTWLDKPAHITSPEHPVAGVPWETAAAFCEWLTRTQKDAGLLPEGGVYRLPTDLEWSAAAGLDGETGTDPKTRDSQDATHFPWSPSTAWPPPARAANLDSAKIKGYSESSAYTCPVTSNNANDRGFYELGGNVSEWCSDPWPDSPKDRVYRGGSWLSSDRDELLTSSRSHAPMDAARGNVGFRCALEFRQP